METAHLSSGATHRTLAANDRWAGLRDDFMASEGLRIKVNNMFIKYKILYLKANNLLSNLTLRTMKYDNKVKNVIERDNEGNIILELEGVSKL